MKKPKRPKKFASAEAKRLFDERQQSWEKLQTKWANMSLTSIVSPSKKSKKPKTKVIVDPVVAERVKEARKVKSKRDTVKGAVALKRSVMDPRNLAKESPEVSEKTIAKSKSIMPIYNKGADQYVTDIAETLKTDGAKTRRPQ